MSPCRGRRPSTKPFPSPGWWRIIVISFPSSPPSTHSLKAHTHTHTNSHIHTHTYTHTRGSPLERVGVDKRAGAEEKSTLRKEKQKVHILPFGTSLEGGRLTCMAVSVCTSLVPNIQDTLFHSTMGFTIFFFQNCSSFCMGPMVMFNSLYGP